MDYIGINNLKELIKTAQIPMSSSWEGFPSDIIERLVNELGNKVNGLINLGDYETYQENIQVEPGFQELLSEQGDVQQYSQPERGLVKTETIQNILESYLHLVDVVNSNPPSEESEMFPELEEAMDTFYYYLDELDKELANVDYESNVAIFDYVSELGLLYTSIVRPMLNEYYSSSGEYEEETEEGVFTKETEEEVFSKETIAENEELSTIARETMYEFLVGINEQGYDVNDEAVKEKCYEVLRQKISDYAYMKESLSEDEIDIYTQGYIDYLYEGIKDSVLLGKYKRPVRSRE